MVAGVKLTSLCILLVGLATGVGLNPRLAEPWQTWTALLLPYSVLTALAVRELRARGQLGARLIPRGGDLSIGIVLGLVMAIAGVVGQRALAPTSSPAAEWLFGIYAQVGNVQHDPLLLVGLVILVAMEEIVWRAMVLETLERSLGRRWTAPASAVAYALAHLPTLWTLAGVNAGLNPLLVLAALGCGLCWSFAALALGRLWPTFGAHLVFSYFMAAPLPSWLPG